MLFGGTSLIILVGVDLDTMRQLDSMMKMHHHDGFVESRKKKAKKIFQKLSKLFFIIFKSLTNGPYRSQCKCFYEKS